MVPDSNDTESFGFEPSSSSRIVDSLPSVLSTIELDDEATLQANEVDDVGAERYLATELELAEPSAAEF
jgi:hypothetical protein